MLRAQTTWSVGSLGHAVLLEGAEATRARLDARIAGGERFFVSDAVDDSDIETTALAVADWPVVTGADALVPALARAIGLHTDATRSERTTHPPTPGREVVLAGGYLSTTEPQPMTILCKAGALGGPDLFERGFERMRSSEDTMPDVSSQ